MNKKSRVALACSSYDRTDPILRGTIKPEGVDLSVYEVNHPAERIAEFKKGGYDVAECSLGELVFSMSRNSEELVGIPVFPLRVFRHGYIFCNAASNIRTPQDLRGKKVGLFRLAQTACIWIRGLLVEEYHLPPRETGWYVPATNPVHHSTEGSAKHEWKTNDGSEIHLLESNEKSSGRSLLEAALIEGKIDALCSAVFPTPFLKGDKRVRRLFENYREVESSYYKKTGIFPIMHILATRRSVVAEHPELPRQLFELFSQAQKLALEKLKAEGSVSLAWKDHYIEEEGGLVPPEAWAYGLAKNRHVLSKFLSYSYDLGVSARRMEPQELFDASTWELQG